MSRVGSTGSARSLVRQALDLGIISSQTAEAIDGLIVLRNLAVHSRELDKIAPSKALEFVALAQAVVYAIEHGNPAEEH